MAPQARIRGHLSLRSRSPVQYACTALRNLLKRHKFIQSMSSKGNCYDNAVAESFFHTLKTEAVYFESYNTREEAKNSLSSILKCITIVRGFIQRSTTAAPYSLNSVGLLLKQPNCLSTFSGEDQNKLDQL